MSTTYNRPLPPVTSLRVAKMVGHDRVTVFVDHKSAGTLTVDAGGAPKLVTALRSDETVARRNGIGDGRTRLTLKLGSNLGWHECIVSEAGEIANLAELVRSCDEVSYE